MSTWRLKPLAGVRHLPKRKKRRGRRYLQPVDGIDATLNLIDTRTQEVWSRLGKKPADYKLAKYVGQQLMVQYPQGTIPELVTYAWLESQGIPFTYQAWVYGGRSRSGGVVPDFVLQYGGRGLAWLTQGEYWHSKPDVSASDVADIAKLTGAWFHGVRIEVVVEQWERDVYLRRPEVFEWGLQGIGLRG